MAKDIKLDISPQEVENLKTILWYISVLSGGPQNLEQNTQYAKQLGQLIQTVLAKPPYSIRYLCSISVLDYSNGYKASARDSGRLLNEAECELVGRGELDPKYRQGHPDEEAYTHGIYLNAQLPRLRLGNIKIAQLNDLAIYVFLLVHAHSKIFEKLADESFSMDLSDLECINKLDEILCDTLQVRKLNNALASSLKEMNGDLNELREMLDSVKPAKNTVKANFFSSDRNEKNANAGIKSTVVNFLTMIYELFKKLIDAIASCFARKTPQPQ